MWHVDGPDGHYSKWNKLFIKRQRVYDSTSMRYLEEFIEKESRMMEAGDGEVFHVYSFILRWWKEFWDLFALSCEYTYYCNVHFKMVKMEILRIFYHNLNNYVKTMCIEERAPASLMRYLFPLKRRCDRKPQIYILVKRNKEHFHQIQEHKAHSYDYY